VIAKKYAIASGHELASQAGLEILQAGGNAVDAGVAAGLALGVVHSDLVNVAGVAPIMIRMAKTRQVITIDGLGTWPRRASCELFERQYAGGIPKGILRTVVPGAPAAWLSALRDFGTMNFGEVARFAIRYAKEGFPAFPLFVNYITEHQVGYQSTEENQRIYLPNGRPPKVDELFVQSDLAASLQYMADQESAAGGSRNNGLQAAYDAFYRGDIARKFCDYHKENGGLLTPDDLAEYQVRFEQPLKVGLDGFDIYCCGPWSQGISLAQMLGLIGGIDVKVLGHNTPEYIHVLTEALKLVFADRERHVADPRFVNVPVGQMLDPGYLRLRSELIYAHKAWPQMPPAGDPAAGRNLISDEADQISLMHGGDDTPVAKFQTSPLPDGPTAPDTSYVCVIDDQGNMFSATPSDSSHDGTVIPGSGLCPSTRGSQSRGISGCINSVAPGKRPRLTPNPALVLRDDEPFMTLGTPGGDVQIQAMTQVFLNVIYFGMDIQTAIEAPRFATFSFPGSFAPNDYYPGLLMLEQRLPEETADKLKSFGHDIKWWPEWSWKAGGVCAIQANPDSGILYAGADPRRASIALGD
jgi:gamma-glutamyltranspeptidase/glutathione hydrolase